MSKVSKQSFIAQQTPKSIDVAQAKSKLAAAGLDASKVAKADLNNDGKIGGAAESEALFKALDAFDSDGNAGTLTLNDGLGKLTKSGKAFEAMGLTKPAAQYAITSPFGKALAEGGAASMKNKQQAHNDSIDKTGVGVYYGDHGAWKTMSKQERTDWLKANAKPGTTPPTPKEASCIGWVYENVGAAYAAAGKSARWNEIQRIVTAQGSKGTDLAKELQKDGWQGIYWNPDAKNPNDGNGEHSYSATVAKNKGTYYGVKLTDTVTDYRPTEGGPTKQNLTGIDKLKKVPFFFGLAKGGMHTFVGGQGKVNEFHWSEMPDSKEAIEETPLQDWGWNSGLIMVPPGSWPQD